MVTIKEISELSVEDRMALEALEAEAEQEVKRLGTIEKLKRASGITKLKVILFIVTGFVVVFSLSGNAISFGYLFVTFWAGIAILDHDLRNAIYLEKKRRYLEKRKR